MKTHVVWIALFPLMLAAETLVSTDFADPDNYVSLPESHPDHITGRLPRGVIEDSAWAGVRTRYRHEKNRLGGDRGWLVVDLQGGDKGQAQLKWELANLDAPAAYRLTLTAASPDNTPLTLAIRDGGPPWKAHWEKTFAPGGFLQRENFDFRLPALGNGKVLIAHLGTRGTLQFQDLSLVRRDEAELAREREEKLANAPSNLLPVTGFPLGLPPLWSNGNRASYESDIRVEAGETPSPRGTVPLRLATRRDGATLDLFSAPFEPRVRSEPHTLSFYIRGEIVDGHVEILADGETLARATLVATPEEWTRVSMTFTPDALAPFHVIHWSLEGDVRIDSLQLNVGSEPNPFRLQRDAEVSLSADRMKNHVIVDGVDPDQVRLAVTGAPAGASVQLAGVNFQGDRQDLPSLATSGEPVQLFDVPLTGLFPGTFGPFRIEARVLVDGEAVSPPSDLVLYRLRKPRHWDSPHAASPFGGHFHPHRPHLYSAKAIGQNWNRLHGDNGKWTYWSGVEPEKGRWTFHPERLEAMRDAGFEILGVWVHCPGWARIKRPNGNGWLDNWWQPRDYGEFTDYVRQVTRAYKPYIHTWQIWNEPWGEFWFKEWRPELGSQHQWHPGPTPEDDYVRLSEVSYAAAKQTDPDVRVLGIQATIGERGKNWMKAMIRRDAEQYADVVSFHAYAGGGLGQLLGDDPEQLKSRIERHILQPLRDKASITEKPEIWLTEGNVLGARPHSGGGLYRYSFILDPEPLSHIRTEAQLLSVYHLVCFSLGIDKVFTYAQNAVESHFQQKRGIYWGALGLNGGELNPSAAVYAAMAWHLEGAEFRKRLERNGVHAFLFQRGATAVAALVAPASRETPWTPPADDSLVWRDCLGNDTAGPFDFGTIVWVERQGSAEELADILTSTL